VNVSLLDLYAGTPVVALADRTDGALAALGAGAGGLELATVDVTAPLSPAELGARVTVGSVGSPRLAAAAGDLWLLGDGSIRRYTTAAGAVPAFASSGSFTDRLADLETDGAQVLVSSVRSGVMEVVVFGSELSLTAVEQRAHPTFGLFRYASGAGGERVWWAEGFGSARTLLREEPISSYIPDLPIYAHLPARCPVWDGDVVGGDLYLLTDCGVERFEPAP
jgi:hypothetical protein